MERMKVHLRKDLGWESIKGVHIRGKAFDCTGLLSSLDLKCKMLNISKFEDFVNLIKILNGFFAIIVERKDGAIWAAVDRMRSIPLFFGHKGNQGFFSDEAQWVIDQICVPELKSPSACTDFLFSGYVTGNRTLYPSLKQLEAGNVLALIPDEKNLKIELLEYYSFLHGDYSTETPNDLLEEQDRVVVGVFERLARAAGGSQKIVPLSRGLDSRLVVMMLKRLGFKNVLCFSYGVPGNREAEISKKVAKELGFHWEFVPYTPELWGQYYHSNLRKPYFSFAHGLSSLPHIQDWPAVAELKKHGIAENGAMFVPGHSGDFLAGSHLGPDFFSNKTFSLDQVIEAIFEKHFVLHHEKNLSKLPSPLEPNLFGIKKRIRSQLKAIPIETPADGASAFEYWDWKERQAKFIVNSVRVYEYYGFSWWLPLWDREMLRFWQKVPLGLREDQWLYKEYVTRVQQICQLRVKESLKVKFQQDIKLALKNIGLIGLARWVQQQAQCKLEPNKKWIEYQKHPLGWYTIIDFDRFSDFYTDKEKINSFIAVDIINSRI
ncbi:MAG: asparagine synthetase B family protein [Candidatus Theseobacter exili]|nr:asparagine synthetase B family protein [Candidatus Theseobacter exili]